MGRGWTRARAVSESIGRTGKVGRRIRNSEPEKDHLGGKVQLSFAPCSRLTGLPAISCSLKPCKD
jgi:hypothetical protein